MRFRPGGVRIASVILLGVASLLSACVSIPTGRLEALAGASRATADGSVQTYARVEGLQRRYLVFNPAEGRLTRDSFKPVIVDDQGRRQDFDLGPRLRVRESALEVLADYTAVLQEFAKKDYQGGLDSATQKLNASVADLAGRVSGGDEARKAAGILATVVNGIGRAVIERVRLNTLRRAMAEAQPGVGGLATQIVADNALIAQAVTTMQNGILRAANAMRPAASPDRLALDDEVSRTVAESEAILAGLESLSNAVKAIPAAHEEIRETLDKPEVSLAQLQALIAEAKRLNKYYRSLR